MELDKLPGVESVIQPWMREKKENEAKRRRVAIDVAGLQ